MKEKGYLASFYYDGEKVYLQEIGVFNVIPLWSLINFAVSVGSHTGPFKGFFKGIGFAISALFTLGTFYKVVNAYISKIKIANGILSFIKTLKGFLTNTPLEVQSDAEYEKFERRYEEELSKSNSADEEDFEKFILEQNLISNIISNIGNLISKGINLAKLIPIKRVKDILLDFLAAAKRFVEGKIFRKTLLEFKFIKKIFSFGKKTIALFLGLFLCFLVLLFVGVLIYHSKKNQKLKDLFLSLLGKTDKQGTSVGQEEAKQVGNEVKNISKTLLEQADSQNGKVVDRGLTEIMSKFANAFKNLLSHFKDITKDGNVVAKFLKGLSSIADNIIKFFKKLFKRD